MRGWNSAGSAPADADGKAAHSKTHGYRRGQSAGDEPTTEGQAGRWTVGVNLESLTGQIVIHIRPA